MRAAGNKWLYDSYFQGIMKKTTTKLLLIIMVPGWACIMHFKHFSGQFHVISFTVSSKWPWPSGDVALEMRGTVVCIFQCNSLSRQHPFGLFTHVMGGGSGIKDSSLLLKRLYIRKTCLGAAAHQYFQKFKCTFPLTRWWSTLISFLEIDPTRILFGT